MYRPNRIGPHHQYNVADVAVNITDPISGYSLNRIDIIAATLANASAPTDENRSMIKSRDQATIANGAFSIGTCVSTDQRIGKYLYTLTGGIILQHVNTDAGFEVTPFIGKLNDNSPVVDYTAPVNLINNYAILDLEHSKVTGRTTYAAVKTSVIVEDTFESGNVVCAGLQVKQGTGGILTCSYYADVRLTKYIVDQEVFDPTRR